MASFASVRHHRWCTQAAWSKNLIQIYQHKQYKSICSSGKYVVANKLTQLFCVANIALLVSYVDMIVGQTRQVQK